MALMRMSASHDDASVARIEEAIGSSGRDLGSCTSALAIGDALLLAAGEIVGALAGERGDVELFERDSASATSRPARAAERTAMSTYH